MSNVRPDNVVAVVCGDLHLSQTPPIARAGEPDWFTAMAASLEQLRNVAERYRCPILCAGDVFDHWKSTPELINFAIDALPHMYAIPGQHDLPFHLMENIEKSAYWTLVKARVITNLSPGIPTRINHTLGCTEVVGFPWGCPVTQVSEQRHGKAPPLMRVALIHDYTWIDGRGYKDAPNEKLVQNGKYTGYNVAVTGDNHISFNAKKDNCLIWNCGGFMRRRGDETQHRPRIGLLHADATITSHYLNNTGEKFSPTSGKMEAGAESFHQLMQFLKKTNAHTLDFTDALRRSMERDDVSESVQKILIEAIEYATAH